MRNRLAPAFGILITVFTAMSARAGGDRVGNGGGLWGCYSSDRSFRSGVLLDLFEAKQQFQLYIPNSGIDQTPNEVLATRTRWLQQALPNTAALIMPALNKVQTNLVLVEANVIQIDDAWPKIQPLPSECPNGEWKYTQFANSTNYGSVLINNQLWTHQGIPLLDKAALIMHEAVYLMLREKYGDTDSIRARHINGLLFSNLPATEIESRILKILGVPTPSPVPPPNPVSLGHLCSVTNWYMHKTYVKADRTEIEAEVGVLNLCQENLHPEECKQSNIRCGKITTNDEISICRADNAYMKRTYLGKGRNEIEAVSHAFQKCEGELHPEECKFVKCSTNS